MNAIGIDPDTKDLAIALWGRGGPVAAMCVHVTGKGDGQQSQVRMAHELSDLSFARWSVLMRPNDALDGRECCCSRIAIEGQQVDGRRARPADLFTLAHTTGSALSWCARWFPTARIIITPPSEWKGSVAKHAMQARLYTDLGWDYTLHGSGQGRYARPKSAPTPFDHISPGQWKHVGDALLLARWAYEHQA